jgi:L-fuconolactonase
MIDSHFHCWQHSWAKQRGILAAPYLQRDFPFEELLATAGPALEAMVEIEVNDFVDGTVEARYIESVAAEHSELRAHVAWAQLEAPDVEAQLDALARIPIVRGVRRTCQIEADAEFCARPEYISGFRRLGERDLIGEICVRLEQIEAVPRLARESPETRLVLQHIGKPNLTLEPTKQWLEAIEALGAQPQVSCKLSVVVHSDRDEPYHAERLAPFVAHAVECFGWDRLLYGSNWPVATAVIEYGAWREMLTEILRSCGAGKAELAKVFGENARELYS